MQRIAVHMTKIQLWINDNFLKPNDVKTEFFMLGTPNNRKRVLKCTASIGNEKVLPSTTVRNIKALMDSALGWSLTNIVSNNPAIYKFKISPKLEIIYQPNLQHVLL